MKNRKRIRSGLICLGVIAVIFVGLGLVMGASNMLNTMMHTAHDLLLNTCFFLMAVCVLTGALGKVMIEFGAVDVLESLLKPLMKPLFNLPGVASLGAVVTFLSDNPAIIGLAKDKGFAKYFKKYQLISINNFGTAFGMGLIVIVFMIGQGYIWEPLVGLVGAFGGCIISTRMMQQFTVRAYPSYKTEPAVEDAEDAEMQQEEKSNESTFIRCLNSLLDGGKGGVEVGLAIIPGVLIISTFVMMLTFGPNAETGAWTGAAYEGTELLPWLGGKISVVFDALFGFKDPHLIAFPITALGAVGAAIGLVPEFINQGLVDGNAIAVFTAIGMCWSGFLSTHTAMLDSLGYRKLLGKAILSHTIGGLLAGVLAHYLYLLITLF